MRASARISATRIDGRDVEIRYRADGGRHSVEVRDAPGGVDLDVLGGAHADLTVR